MQLNRKDFIKVAVSLLAIGGSIAWMYYAQKRAPRFNVEIYQYVGRLLAEQAAELIGRKNGKIVVVTLASHDYEELDAEYAAFNQRLKKLGEFKVHEDRVHPEGKPKYGLGMGLSGRHFLRLVRKQEAADVIVSFIGAPKLTEAEALQLTNMPKFVVQARTPDHLFKLFQKNLVQAAVISRFTFPAPGPITPKTTQDWFNKRFQVFSNTNSAAIPPDARAE